MEKRKDIDMLRFYGGDIHQKNKEGEYVITNNLVNPKNKEDVLWGDRDAYRTLNALLFDGIENEKERIYKEKRKLNPVFIELIENTLEIYRGIFAVMCRKKGNQLSVSKVKRVDRKASLMAYLKGHTESFVSCTNGEYDDEFASKNNIILLEIESLENLVLYQKYTYEDACRLLNWERNEVPLNIGGYKYDKKTKTFPIFINYDKQDNISDTTKYEDHFVAENRLIAISKSGRSMDSEDVQNFLNATERGIDVQLFVRKNKDDKISKEFYYLGRVIATGNAKQFVMPNTDKTAVEIEWELETPVREDIYQYIVNE